MGCAWAMDAWENVRICSAGWIKNQKSLNFCLVFPTQLEETHSLTKVVKQCTYIVNLVQDSTINLCSSVQNLGSLADLPDTNHRRQDDVSPTLEFFVI